jgi:hypothetical protein
MILLYFQEMTQFQDFYVGVLFHSVFSTNDNRRHTASISQLVAETERRKARKIIWFIIIKIK